MSYSFSVRAANKVEAKQKVADEMAKVVASQPCHAHDQAQAVAAVEAFIDCLPDDDSKDVMASVSGSLGWLGSYPDSHVFTNAGVSAYAALVTRQA